MLVSITEETIQALISMNGSGEVQDFIDTIKIDSEEINAEPDFAYVVANILEEILDELDQ